MTLSCICLHYDKALLCCTSISLQILMSSFFMHGKKRRSCLSLIRGSSTILQRLTIAMSSALKKIKCSYCHFPPLLLCEWVSITSSPTSKPPAPSSCALCQSQIAISIYTSLITTTPRQYADECSEEI